MADNVTIGAVNGDADIAADDVAGVMVQRIKVGHGAEGAYGDATPGNPLPVGLAPGRTVGTARVSTIAGTAVQLPDVAGVLGVTIKARRANVATVYVGGVGGGAIGFELEPGEAVSVDVTNPAVMWFDVASDGDGVCCLWVVA